MTTRDSRQLNPLALAVAAGCTAFIAALLVGFPMMGVGAMMGRGYGFDGGAMWGYRGGNAFGFGPAFVIGGALLAALVGAIFAWIYNAVSSRSVPTEENSK